MSTCAHKHHKYFIFILYSFGLLLFCACTVLYVSRTLTRSRPAHRGIPVPPFLMFCFSIGCVHIPTDYTTCQGLRHYPVHAVTRHASRLVVLPPTLEPRSVTIALIISFYHLPLIFVPKPLQTIATPSAARHLLRQCTAAPLHPVVREPRRPTCTLLYPTSALTNPS